MPKWVCIRCLEKLEIAYYFRIQVENSDYNLRNRNNTIKEIIIISALNTNVESEQPIDAIGTTSSNGSCDDVNLEMTEYLKLSERSINSPSSEDISAIKNDNISEKPRVLVNRVKPRKFQKKKQHYQCDTCGKIFNKTNQLKVHIRTHTGMSYK